ncbi:MAG: methylenetetrahydrofolate reductase [NAD(P)H] [Ruminococcus sp.]|nr:methylenetetrahydrofolate reductase [NAD(P)H] [Ruminococcus sp.]
MKISDLFQQKTVLSFEVFPPKPTADESIIYQTLNGLSGLNPDFISVTYSAGGGKNNRKTIQIASDIKRKYNIESVAHLPCISLSEEDAIEILDSLQENGIENILALRGDILPDTKPNGKFSYASELIEFINERYDFNIIAACYPEGHSESNNIIDDINYLKYKVDCGASHLITQLFLDNDDFYKFRERAEIKGISVPIEAGIMPVTNKAQIERMVKLCGIKLPQKFMKMIERYENNPTALRDAGIAYAIDQIVDLISHDAEGIHLYTMNNPYVAKKIYEAVYRLIAVKC